MEREVEVEGHVRCVNEFNVETKTPDETKLQRLLLSSKCKLFQVFFLMNDDDLSVEVVETSEIDLGEVVGCLQQGDSIFITCKARVE
jgi:hypothetical protein